MTLRDLKDNNVEIRIAGRNVENIKIYIGNTLPMYKVEGEYAKLDYNKIPEETWNKIADKKISSIHNDWEDLTITLEE